MAKEPVKAIARNVINVDGFPLEVFVTEDGRRVISDASLEAFFGMSIAELVNGLPEPYRSQVKAMEGAEGVAVDTAIVDRDKSNDH